VNKDVINKCVVGHIIVCIVNADNVKLCSWLKPFWLEDKEWLVEFWRENSR